MGKKSKFKAIRRLAAQMPVINKSAVIEVERVKGSTLIEEGTTEVNGKPVIDHENYKRVKTGPVAINHKRKMKKLYNAHGKKGVGSYLQAVNNYLAQQKKTV